MLQLYPILQPTPLAFSALCPVLAKSDGKVAGSEGRSCYQPGESGLGGGKTPSEGLHPLRWEVISYSRAEHIWESCV